MACHFAEKLFARVPGRHRGQWDHRPALVDGVLYLPAVTPNQTTPGELEKSPGIVLVVHPWDVPTAQRLLTTLLQAGKRPTPLSQLIDRLLRSHPPKARLPDYATILQRTGLPANPVQEVLTARDPKAAALLVAQWLEAITLLRALDPLVPHRLTPTIIELARHAINEAQLHAMIHYWDTTAALVQVARFRSLALRLLTEVTQTEREHRSKVESKLEELTRRQLHLTTELSAMVGRVERLASETTCLQASVARIEGRLEEFNRRLTELRSALSHLRKEVEELGGRVSGLCHRVEELRHRVEGQHAKTRGRGRPAVPVVPPIRRARRRA